MHNFTAILLIILLKLVFSTHYNISTIKTQKKETVCNISSKIKLSNKVEFITQKNKIGNKYKTTDLELENKEMNKATTSKNPKEKEKFPINLEIERKTKNINQPMNRDTIPLQNSKIKNYQKTKLNSKQNKKIFAYCATKKKAKQLPIKKSFECVKEDKKTIYKEHKASYLDEIDEILLNKPNSFFILKIFEIDTLEIVNSVSIIVEHNIKVFNEKYKDISISYSDDILKDFKDLADNYNEYRNGINVTNTKLDSKVNESLKIEEFRVIRKLYITCVQINIKELFEIYKDFKIDNSFKDFNMKITLKSNAQHKENTVLIFKLRQDLMVYNFLCILHATNSIFYDREYVNDILDFSRIFQWSKFIEVLLKNIKIDLMNKNAIPMHKKL